MDVITIQWVTAMGQLGLAAVGAIAFIWLIRVHIPTAERRCDEQRREMVLMFTGALDEERKERKLDRQARHAMASAIQGVQCLWRDNNPLATPAP